MRYVLMIVAIMFVSACSANYWRCSWGNPSDWDANTLEYCKYYNRNVGRK